METNFWQILGLVYLKFEKDDYLSNDSNLDLKIYTEQSRIELI